jgi:type IV secretory pathway TrbD component
MAHRRSITRRRAGLVVPVHRALTEPILLGGAPRAIAIMNGTLAGAIGLGLRLWLVGLVIWAIGHISRPSGRQARSALRRRGAPASAHPTICRSEERADDEPRRISQRPPARRLPALGRAGRRPGVVLNKDGSFQRTARFRGPDLDSAVPAELVASPGGSTTPSAVSARAGRSSSRRSATGARPIPTALSRSGLGLVDAERKAEFEEEGAHFESSYFLTFLYLPPAEDAARAEAGSMRAARSRASTARDAARLHRSHRPRAAAGRRLHAGVPLAR